MGKKPILLTLLLVLVLMTGCRSEPEGITDEPPHEQEEIPEDSNPETEDEEPREDIPELELKDAAELYSYITGVHYSSWQKAPGYGIRQPALGPHRNEVDIYINNLVVETLQAGEAVELPAGALIVKDAFRNGSLNEIAAMLKLENGAWFWAEWDGNGRHLFSGEDIATCIRCHIAENDRVLAFKITP